MHRLADVLEQAAGELLPSIVNEVGTPVSLAAFLQVRMAVRAAPALGGGRGQGRPDPPPGPVERARPHDERRGARAGRRGGRHHRLQLPAQPGDLQVRRRAGRRVHGRAAAVPADAADHAVPGRADPPGRTAPGRDERDHRQRGRRPAAVVAPGRRPGLLHRLRRGGRDDHGAGRAATSPASRWSSAGSRRASSCPAPTSGRSPWRPTCGGRATAARAAPRWPGCWSTSRCTTSSWPPAIQPSADGGRRPLGPGDQHRPDDQARPPGPRTGFIDDSLAAGGRKLLEVAETAARPRLVR